MPRPCRVSAAIQALEGATRMDSPDLGFFLLNLEVAESPWAISPKGKTALPVCFVAPGLG